MKSVIIAFSNPLLSNWITTVLNRGGYSIEYTCKTGGDVARVADFCTSPVVVCGFQFPDMTAEDLQPMVTGRLELVTVILPHQRDMAELSGMFVLPYPVASSLLLETIENAEKKAACEALGVRPGRKEEDRPLERPAEEKLIIIRAKNIIMEQHQMTESQAHRFLQKTSMDRGLKLIESARMVIDNTL